ncbi:MAG: acyl-CoA reductase [Candidatus Auribacterota bacterium]|nr:acyl-CoA reductase [Candidatus Auribacterota bacterium]
MITCYLKDAIFQERELDDFKEIALSIEKARDRLRKFPIGAILEILGKLGSNILADKDLNHREGISYLCLWLRKNNLRSLIELNLRDIRYLDEFVSVSRNSGIKAQPRGIICHWIAGNITTLAVFSLVESVMAKNGNIVKVPEGSADLIIRILKKLGEIEVLFKDNHYSGRDILNSISILSFSSSETLRSREFSMIADGKVIWGGKQAVSSILALPQQEHCESIIFGPKYSFSVFDRGFIEEEDMDGALKKTVLDIIAFDQRGCSSPHVVFFEKSGVDIKELAARLANCFKEITKKYPMREITPYASSEILDVRARYYLDPEKDIIASDGCGWTVLINKDLRLEEPVQNRTIFIKEVVTIDDVIQLITKKVQTIGVAIKEEKKRERFCSEVTYHGVARCVVPGLMNNFDAPWDGIFLLSRLVRFVSLRT